MSLIAQIVFFKVIVIRLLIKYINKMNKQFEYRDFNFNIKVELNTKVEKRIDGERWHTVTTNCMDGGNYYKKEEVNDKFLVPYILACERLAEKCIDEKIDGKSSPDARLSELGFK
jgi:hypothetical protein